MTYEADTALKPAQVAELHELDTHSKIVNALPKIHPIKPKTSELAFNGTIDKSYAIQKFNDAPKNFDYYNRFFHAPNIENCTEYCDATPTTI